MSIAASLVSEDAKTKFLNKMGQLDNIGRHAGQRVSEEEVRAGRRPHNTEMDLKQTLVLEVLAFFLFSVFRSCIIILS